MPRKGRIVYAEIELGCSLRKIIEVVIRNGDQGCVRVMRVSCLLAHD